MTQGSRNRAAVGALTVLLMSGTAATGSAQGARPAMPATAGMHGMAGMMEGPHHVLAMAYLSNLETFARALKADLATTKKVNPDIAGPAVAEMRRSFDQMKTHHDAQMATMSNSMKTSMAKMMPDMEKHHAALAEHLTALEAELQSATPSPERVSEHTAEIVKHCDGMMKIHPEGAAHRKP